MGYRIVENGVFGVIFRDDGSSFLADDRDPSWPEYLSWLKKGGEPVIEQVPAEEKASEKEAIVALAEHLGLTETEIDAIFEKTEEAAKITPP